MSSPLKAVHLVDQRAFLVEKSWSVELEVDGLPTPDRQFTVQSLDHILQVSRKQGEVLTYRDTDGNTITAAEHAQQKARLLAGSSTDEDGDRHFQSLDAEFDYRKFEARWSVGERAPDVVTKQPVEVQVVEVRTNSGDPDIVSLWNATHVKRDATLYSFDRDLFMVRLCQQLCIEAGLDYSNEGNLSGYLRFAKLDGEYAFGDSFDKSRGSFISTLAECMAEKEKCRERVSSIVRVRAIKKVGAPIANAGDVVLALRDLQRRLAGIFTTPKSSADMSHARKRLSDLIETIERGLTTGSAS